MSEIPQAPPGEGREQVLELLAALATSVSRTIVEDWLANDTMHQTPEARLLERTRRILVLNAHHVPLEIDRALDHIEAHRPKS